MKIVDKRETLFENVEPATALFYKGELWLKTNTGELVNFKNGKLIELEPDEMVYEIDAEVAIYERG